MAHVQTTPTELVIQLRGAQRALGRWRPLVVPRARVTRAYADEAAARAYPGAKYGVGSYAPGLIKVGSFRRAGRRDFWAVRDPRKAIVIELTGDKYDRLILEVDDIQRTLAALSA